MTVDTTGAAIAALAPPVSADDRTVNPHEEHRAPTSRLLGECNTWPQRRVAVNMPAQRKPEQAAQQLLEGARAYDGNLTLPVDPVVLARGMGINVYHASMPASVSGYLIKHAGRSGPDIFLNENHSPVRQRFTCAHELGHYAKLFESGATPPETYYFKRDELAACGVNTDEIFANQFAAELLMPRDIVTDLMARGMNQLAIARTLQVSPDAIGHRLVNLGLKRT